MKKDVENLVLALAPLRQELLSHPLYKSMDTRLLLTLFMEQHCYAVWDFMSLLKALQNGLTCVSLPWVPVGSPTTRRFINEIVLGEESDLDNNHVAASHYELYLNAMDEIGADTQHIKTFVNKIAEGGKILSAIDATKVRPETMAFMDFTFSIISKGKLHEIAAVFTFGREDLIPDMFIEIVKGLQEKEGVSTSRLLYYLERHIEIDGGEHGPISLQMMDELCGDDPIKWQEATSVSLKALQMRIELWNGVLKQIEKTNFSYVFLQAK